MIALNKSFLRAILKFTFVLAYPACAPWGICISQEVITARTEAEAKEFFEGQVLPLLQKHCYPCHSHSSGLMESNLALDWKSGWVKGGERGPAIQPGKPEASLLVRVIEHIDPDLKMPEDKLDERDIEIFRTWIRNGAFDHRDAPSPSRDPKDWWSLKPLVSPPLPKPLSDQASSSIRKADASGTNNTHPIDAFVTEKLAAAKLDGVGLSLSPSASPRELIRRLFYDLIGLPPTPEQTQRFVDSPTPEAYLELVNGLLDSPRYGERWARHWLDSIHFADSHGYEHDVGRDHAWPYRDYVIQALNRDTPWQTFIRQQLAIDVFEPDATDLLPALGFLGAGTFDLSTFSTGRVTFDYLDRDDMLTQTMAAFVSTTANCARCHTHKFDPITQEDYYAIQAVFAGVIKGDVLYDADPMIGARRKQLLAIKDAAERKEHGELQSSEAGNLVASWLKTRGDVAAWKDLPLDSFISLEGANLTRTQEGFILASGVSPDTDTTILTTTPNLPRVTAIRVDLFPHDSLPMRGPGRCQNGNLHLSEVSMSLFQPDEPSRKALKIGRATADFNQEGWGIERAIDGDPKTAWGIHPAVGQPHYAVFELAEPIELQPGSKLTITLKQLHGGSHLLGAFQVRATDAPPQQTVAVPIEVERILSLSEEQRSAEDRQSLYLYFARLAAEESLSKLPPQMKVFAVGKSVDIPNGNGKYQSEKLAAPKPVHMLQRGDIAKPLQVVPPGALSVLDHAPSRFLLEGADESSARNSESSRRAELANWIAHKENVLTWRSIVNRVWHYHFGRGLCDTPSDLGRMGGVPSHPELIDWLACWFRDEANGSLKQLHRLIVTSKTYQQACEEDPRASSIDAGNRLLWRQNRLRLDADSFRDYLLALSGKIDLTQGGPAIQHFSQQPGPQSTPKLDYASYDWSQPGANRRSIYRYVWRGIPDPLMAVLDFPDLGLLAPTRGFSASPLQSLALYNNPFILTYSQATAERLRASTSDPHEQIRLLIQLAYQRDPSDSEWSLLEAYANKHGLAALCRVVINSNEFLFLP